MVGCLLGLVGCFVSMIYKPDHLLTRGTADESDINITLPPAIMEADGKVCHRNVYLAWSFGGLPKPWCARWPVLPIVSRYFSVGGLGDMQRSQSVADIRESY